MIPVILSILMGLDLASQAHSMKCVPNLIEPNKTESWNQVICNCVNNSDIEDFSLQKDVLETISEDFIADLNAVHINDCNRVKLDLVIIKDSHYAKSCPLIVTNARQVHLLSLQDPGSNSFFCSNVTINLPSEEPRPPDSDSTYFYSTLGLSAVIVLIILVVLIIYLVKKLHCRCLPNWKKARGQKVSRTHSWRFESNHFINPPPRARNQAGSAARLTVSPPILPPSNSGVLQGEIIPLQPRTKPYPSLQDRISKKQDNVDAMTSEFDSFSSDESEGEFTSRPTLPMEKANQLKEQLNTNRQG